MCAAFHQAVHHILRHHTFKQAACRLSGPYHVGGEESCDNADSYYYGIKEVACHAERYAKRGYNKGELTDLCQRETALHRDAQGLARKQEAGGAKHCLPHNDGDAQHHYGQPIGGQHSGVDQHAHRHKEYGSKEVFDG